MFDSSMAISYMFNSKEPGVLDYIGNRLFTYPDAEIDFFLPQVTTYHIILIFVMFPNNIKSHHA